MGSLGPVKLLKEKKPAELAKNLLEDISNKSLKMGNLCSVGASGAAKKVSTTLMLMSFFFFLNLIRNFIKIFTFIIIIIRFPLLHTAWRTFCTRCR